MESSGEYYICPLLEREQIKILWPNFAEEVQGISMAFKKARKQECKSMQVSSSEDAEVWWLDRPDSLKVLNFGVIIQQEEINWANWAGRPET